MKTHSTFYRTESGDPFFPPDKGCKVIHIARNPIDVAVSFAYHNNKSVDHSVDIMSQLNFVLAGHAVRAALRPLMGKQDWEQCGLFEQKRFPIPKLAKLIHGHITYRQLLPHLPKNQWEELYSFAFVRNPFDRFVSYNAFFNRGNDTMKIDPLGTMKKSIRNPKQRLHFLMRPQYEFITNRQGEIMISHVGRYEDLQEECNMILQRFGGDKFKLPNINSSKRSSYPDYFDDELREMVGKAYARDLEYFDYKF